VQDSNGKVIGQYFSNGSSSFVLVTMNGNKFVVAVTPTGFSSSGTMYFTQFDCGGTPYMEPDTAYTDFALHPVIVGSTIYLSGTQSSVITTLSTQSDGVCTPSYQPGITVYNVAGTVDLSIFVAPFSLH
jgi:hypothetical protein